MTNVFELTTETIAKALDSINTITDDIDIRKGTMNEKLKYDEAIKTAYKEIGSFVPDNFVENIINAFMEENKDFLIHIHKTLRAHHNRNLSFDTILVKTCGAITEEDTIEISNKGEEYKNASLYKDTERALHLITDTLQYLTFIRETKK